MNDQEQDRSVDEEPNSDEEAVVYEPPAIVVLGSVDQLTAFNGSNGEVVTPD